MGKDISTKKIRIALAGNPNCGKSCTFNNLTGLQQKVTNYPGETVEKKVGKYHYEDYEIEVIDLPGIYGLSTYTLEEKIAKDFIVNEKPDLIVNIVDAAHLERNLYLSLQLLELKVPMLICLNMLDEAGKAGMVIDSEKLSVLLNLQVVEIEANTGIGTKDLMREIVNFFDETRKKVPLNLPYNEKLYGEYSDESVISEVRYSFINGIIEKVQKKQVKKEKLTDGLDSLILHRFLGLPIFFFIVWLMFQITFSFSKLPSEWILKAMGFLGDNIFSKIIPSGLFQDLIVDGILGGVSAVLSFIPQITLLFISIAILEDSGYMARAAYLMDDFMHKIGLHGKSFVPMMIGFGCNVPAIMATRTLPTKRERILTAMIIPFMSCSARLPIYILLSSAFFPSYMAGNTVFSLYFIGILAAFFTAIFLDKRAVCGERTDFVLELPPYRKPTFKNIFLHTWNRLKHYLEKAGTLIVLVSIIIWFLTTFPTSKPLIANSYFGETSIENSFAGTIGRFLEPLVKPLGFDWKIGIALITGFSAKEVVVATLGTIFKVAGDSTHSLAQILASQPGYSPLMAYALMVFVLLYTPCFATVAILKQELGSRWAFVSVIYSLAVAWLSAFLIFQGGHLLGFS